MNIPNRPQAFFRASINMIGQFLQVRRGGEEAIAARISYKRNEHTATVGEAQDLQLRSRSRRSK